MRRGRTGETDCTSAQRIAAQAAVAALGLVLQPALGQPPESAFTRPPGATPGKPAGAAVNRVGEVNAPSVMPPKPLPASQRAPRALDPAARDASAPLGANHVLPADLLKRDDRSALVVNGKPTTVGTIKREIAAELRRLSGPPTSASSASRVAARAAQSTMQQQRVPVKPNFTSGSLAPPPSPKIQPAIGPSITASNHLRAEALADPKTYCRTHAPAIMGVRGALEPGRRITIEGVCFGNPGGEIEVIGQFSGGKLKLAFERWSEIEIVAAVPPVRGAADHTVAVTVVRSDRRRTPAAQASFVATRERVEVPGRYWDPTANFTYAEIAEGGGNILTGYIAHGASSGPSSTPFALSINKACELDTVVWTATVGRIDGLSGWEDGPAHQAQVSVAWTPRCTTRTANYVFASNSHRICGVEFSLQAWAMCPAGIAP
jgi:hypothetical protein